MIERLTVTEEDGERNSFDWGEIVWMDSSTLADQDALTVGKVTIRAGEANPEHRHPDCEEALYLLEGRLEHAIGEESVTLSPGDLLHIPAGEPHSAVNPGDSDAVAVITYDTGDRGFEPLE